MKVRVILLLILACVVVAAEDSSVMPEVIVENYCAASRDQSTALKGASMEMDFDAVIPKLKKHGKLHALRRISALGRITYEMLRFEGDNTIKSQVIERYLTAEAEAQKEQSPSLAVTPANYKFKYKGRGQLDGRAVHIFEVNPRQKRQGLFKGQVWIDADTYLRVQEAGYLVKNYSFLIKRIDFVKKYRIRDGISFPLQVQSVVDTRLVGKTELTIDYTNFSMDPARRAALSEAEDQ